MPNRNINTELWNDTKFTDDFTAEDKYFWLFLLTTKYGNLSGCFELSYNQIAKDMGYSKESAQNLVYRFVNNHKMITYDERTSEVLIHNWYKYNWTKSPKMEANIYGFIDKIKSNDLRNIITEMYEQYKNEDRVSIGYQYLTNTKPIPITVSKTKSFVIPTYEEVLTYCNERNNKVDANKWYNFYQSKGWMVGKNKMKDWKAAVRTWEETEVEEPKKEYLGTVL